VRAKVRAFSYKSLLQTGDKKEAEVPAPDMDLFLKPGLRLVLGTRIQEVAASVKGADTLTTVRNTVRWLERNIEYKRGSYKNSEEAINRGYGDCGAFSSIFAALCRANGIPARATWGVIKAGPEFTPEGHLSGHGWAEFYQAGVGWIPLEPQQEESIGFTGTSRVLFYRYGNLSPFFQRTINLPLDTYHPSYEEAPLEP
jgi:transglutaminase-like putative cysteine protease